MQNEIKKICEVPSKKGTIENPGWARSEVMRYTRNNIKAPWYRIKEWDYYLFTNDKFGLAFTISDLGYIGLLSVSYIDFVSKTEITDSEIVPLTKGKAFHLNTTVEKAGAFCHTKRLNMTFENNGKHRHIHCEFKNFGKKDDFIADIDAYEPSVEPLYIATPWKEKETAFYYNCKKNCFEAKGIVHFGEKILALKRETTLGVLDWGRGVWTYDNTWYWGTGSGRVNGEAFGFNLGYGFSDRSQVSENCVYYKEKIHKLEEVTFHIPEENNVRQYTKQWTITSNNQRFEAIFNPILDRSANMNFGVIASDQHQVFGRMNGYTILDDGSKLEFKDFICALEVVRNKY